MANLMYLYTVDSIPDDKFEYNKDHAALVCDSKWDTPIGFYLLMTNSVKLSKSFIWKDVESEKKYNAITSKYDIKCVDTFIEFLKSLAKEDNMKEIEEIESLLKNKDTMKKYFHLETAEIACMTASTPDEINKEIENEMSKIKDSKFIGDIIKNSANLCDIDDYTKGSTYWNFNPQSDKSNSSLRGFNKRSSLANKRGKKLLIKESKDMEGLFNINIFEESKSEQQELKLNESVQEIIDKCPSMNPTEDFDKSAAPEKEIPVPGGDKEQPNAKAPGGEQGPTIPGGDNEKPTAKPEGGEQGPAIPGGDKEQPTDAKVLLDVNTYNAALDKLQQSFKEAADTIAFLQNVHVLNESTEVVEIDNVKLSYKKSKKGFDVYDLDGDFIGTYESIRPDLEYDVRHNPDKFKGAEKK